MNTGRIVVSAVAVVTWSAVCLAGNLLPDTYLSEICKKTGTGITYLAAGDGMPDGICVTTDKALDPVYSIETSAPVPGAAKEGDLLVLTVAVRGVSPGGEASVLVKLQDSIYTGALRGNLTATSSNWTWCRITGVAPKDYADGTMRLHVYPWTGVQQLELRGWTLENKGQVAASTLPSLPAAPTWPAGTLEAPEASATPEAETLPDLTPAQLAKKRYVMFKFDDVKNNYGRVHDRYKRVANYLGGRGHHAGFGVIVKGLDQEPNEACVEWLKTNAVENGGNFEFWDHGWDHAMGFNCAEDDDCDPSVSYGGEFGTSLSHQRAHLTQSIDVFRQCTGLTFHTLGTAGNVGNADTLTALRDHPEMKVWIFGSVAADDVLVLERKVNLEYEVGKVSYATFVSTYKNHRQRDYMVLQGHPAMWDDANFAQFTNVVVQLEKDGWIFVTPYEYYQLLNGWESESGTVTGNDLYVGYPKATPTAPYSTPATAAATLTDALAAAADGATIHVAPGTYEQNGVIIVSNAVTIVGDAASPTNVVFLNKVTAQWSIDRGNFIVRNAGAVLANLTLQGGYAAGTNNGGISRAGNLDLEDGTVTNCVLMSGTCNNASGEAGGACVRGGLLVDCVIEDSGAGNRAFAIFVYQVGGRVERCTMRHGRDTFVKTLNTRLPAVNVHEGVMTDCWIEDFSLVHADGKATYTQLNDGNSGVALVVGSSAEVSDCVFFDYRYVNHDSVPGDMYGLRENCERCVFQSAPAPFVPVVGGTERPFVVGTDSVSIMIRNAVVGQQYGYRKAATIEGLAKASIVPLAVGPTTNGRLTVEIPRDEQDGSCFYQIVAY